MNIKIGNANSATDNKSHVRVYVGAEKIAEVCLFSTTNPLGYLRKHQSSKYWDELRDQVAATGKDLWEVEKIMSIARGTYVAGGT